MYAFTYFSLSNEHLVALSLEKTFITDGKRFVPDTHIEVQR